MRRETIRPLVDCADGFRTHFAASRVGVVVGVVVTTGIGKVPIRVVAMANSRTQTNRPRDRPASGVCAARMTRRRTK